MREVTREELDSLDLLGASRNKLTPCGARCKEIVREFVSGGYDAIEVTFDDFDGVEGITKENWHGKARNSLISALCTKDMHRRIGMKLRQRGTRLFIVSTK